ncbi:hypothetical protein V6N13_131772 [Hibiscus sabdariffa]
MHVSEPGDLVDLPHHGTLSGATDPFFQGTRRIPPGRIGATSRSHQGVFRALPGAGCGADGLPYLFRFQSFDRCRGLVGFCYRGGFRYVCREDTGIASLFAELPEIAEGFSEMVSTVVTDLWHNCMQALGYVKENV